MSSAVAKPTANSLTGTGWTSAANAYDGASGNESTTYANGNVSRASSGSTTGTMTLTTFNPPANFTPETLYILAAVAVADPSAYGAFARARYSTNGGSTYSNFFSISAGDPNNDGANHLYSVSVAGIAVANIKTDFTVYAASDGVDLSSANQKVYDCWIAGTVPGGGAVVSTLFGF